MGKKVEPFKASVVDEALAKRVAGGYVIAEESRKRLLKLAGTRVVATLEVIDIERSGSGVHLSDDGVPPDRDAV